MQAVMDALLVDEFKLAGENIVERDFEDVTSAITTEPTWSVVKKWGTAELENFHVTIPDVVQNSAYPRAFGCRTVQNSAESTP